MSLNTPVIGIEHMPPEVVDRIFEQVKDEQVGILPKWEPLVEKPSNPKDMIGTDKVPLSLVPATALAYQAVAHLEGNLKYGLVNWREAGVRTSIYIDALQRHCAKFVNGEWEDPETHVPHLASMGACINIIIDAYESGKLIDDRPKSAPANKVIDRLSGVVKHLRQIFADKNPIHYTIGGPKRKGDF